MTEDDILSEVMNDPVARWAFLENEVRRSIASLLRDRIRALNMGPFEFETALGLAGLLPEEIRRILHQDLGGSVSLKVICRAADVLGCRLEVGLTPIEK